MEIVDGVEQDLKFPKDDIHGASFHFNHSTVPFMPNVVNGSSQSHIPHSRGKALASNT